MNFKSVFDSQGRRETIAVILISLFLITLVVAALPGIKRYFVEQAHEANQATLRLASGGVYQAIRRFDPLPELISEDPSLRKLLQEPKNQRLVQFANEKLRSMALSLEASDIYLMDPDGSTIASSNYRDPHSFLGNNYSYRPYFLDAMKGASARFHALGTTSGEPGFFFAAPVHDDTDVVGVLTLKVTTDAIEDGWAGSGRDILVSDEHGIVFLTSNSDLRFRALTPLTQGTLNQIRDTKQLPLDMIKPLQLSADVIKPGSNFIQLGTAAERESFLSDSAQLNLPGWHAIVLSPHTAIMKQAAYVVVFCVLAILVLILAALIVVQRRARTTERTRVERSQRALLERTVEEKTADLRVANDSLRTEVNERRLTEERLRQTQKELVHSGKLAGLGQMSAAISHEINQPLTAIKSYAKNAIALVDRQRLDEARSNLSDISKMADRMAAISGHLRSFARRPGDHLKEALVGNVIDEALKVISPLAKESNAEIRVTPPDSRARVVGGPLRLQQVIVNILANALDASAQLQICRVDIGVFEREKAVDIVVRDYGEGLAPGAEEHVFEPFFTTKEVGAGMGLGLSISYNIVEDFGGKLSAENHPEGGAMFRIALQKAPRDGGGTDTAMVAEG